MLDSQKTVANVVLDHSECAQVFQRHRIDFCCKGGLTLEDAARTKGVALDALLADLERAISQRRGDTPAEADPRALSTPRLVAHIVSRHHEYLRRVLPFVRALAEKVGRVHGDHNPSLRDLHVAVEALSASLLPHLDEEESALFPALMSVKGETSSPPSVTEQLSAMTKEHLEVATLLERVRAAADDFTLPPWACNSYRTLFAELEQLERDVFTHVHLENHVLAPRFAVS
jgi:regulator of cell morphogenesis and NO signaling